MDPDSLARLIRRAALAAQAREAAQDATKPSLPDPESFDKGYGRIDDVMLMDLLTPQSNEELSRAQFAGYIPNLSEYIYARVVPRSYSKDPTLIADIARRIITGDIPEVDIDTVRSGREYQSSTMREDAWRKYLGLPQKFNSISPSEYSPSRSSDEDTQYFKLNNLWDTMLLEGGGYMGDVGARGRLVNSDIDTDNPVERIVKFLSDKPNRQAVVSGFTPEEETFGDFKLGLGEDDQGHYISYYDKWDFDLDLLQEQYKNIPGVSYLLGHAKIPGAPFEFYDRIYYDPETYEIIPGQQGQQDPDRSSSRTSRSP